MKVLALVFFILNINNIIGEYIEKSKVDVHLDNYNEIGDSWITLEDVCVFKPPKSGRPVVAVYNNKFYAEEFDAYGFYYVFTPEKDEVKYYWPESEGVWYLPNYSNTLFVKWDNFMLYKIYGDKNYPPVKTLIFDSFSINSPPFEMQRLYDKIYTSKYENVKKYYMQDMTKYFRKYEYICFKELHTINRSGFNGFFFIDRSLRIKFRDDGYRITNIYNKNNINDDDNNDRVIEIGVMIRKNNERKREIKNLKEILLLLKDLENKNFKIKYEVICFDGISARDQILLIMNKQIIISPHGANLCNILWILNTKATIIECYSLFRTDAYLKLSVMMNYRYFPLPSPYLDALPLIKNFDKDVYVFEDYPYIHHNRFFYHPLKHFGDADIIVSIKQILFGIFLTNLKKNNII